MIKYFQIILLVLNIYYANAQDTVYFIQYDTIKTSAEDSQKNTDKDSRIIKLNKNLDEIVLRAKNNFKKDPDNFDVKLFRSINNSRSKFKDGIIPIFDKSAPPMTLFMPLTLMVYSRFKKNYYDENTGYLMGGSEFLNLLLTFGLKSYFHRPRPYAELDNVHCKKYDITDPYSFPSGHTSISFTLAVMFNLRYPKFPQVYIPVYLYSLIVAYGRPYLGMHYPSDLFCGALIGAGSAALVYSLRKPLFKIKNEILSEDKPDEGSIDGKTIYIFGGAFVASAILGQFLFNDNQKIQLSVSPYGKANEIMTMNLNVRF